MPSELESLYAEFDQRKLMNDKRSQVLEKLKDWVTKFEPGRTVFRILPTPPGAKFLPWITRTEHFVEVPGTQKKVSFVCRRVHGPKGDKSCPGCDIGEELARSKNKIDLDKAKQCAPVPGIYTRGILREYAGIPVPDGKIRYLKIPKVVRSSLENFCDSVNGAGVDIAHPMHGHDIIVVRTGVDLNNTRYQVMLDPKGPSPLCAEQQQIINVLTANKADPLTNILAVESVADIKKRFEAVGNSPMRPTHALPSSVSAADTLDDDDFLNGDLG